MSDQNTPAPLLHLTADIVSAQVSNSSITADALPALIQSVYAALASAGAPAPVAQEARPEPAVPVKRSVQPEYIVCLEDGAKLKMLKRYIATRYQMTPAQYRARWGLPPDYPMVAPAYVEKRSVLAKTIGLGRKRAEPEEAPVKAPRRSKAAAEGPVIG